MYERLRKYRADERTRTADLISLRVISKTLQGFARGCKSRISKRLSLLWVAERCTVLRSRWYQSGIKRPWITRVDPLGSTGQRGRRARDRSRARSTILCYAMGTGISMPCSAATSTSLPTSGWSSKTSGLPSLSTGYPTASKKCSYKPPGVWLTSILPTPSPTFLCACKMPLGT